MLAVVKAQVLIEQFMISFLEAHGRNAKQFFFTKQKIDECARINPPEINAAMWELLLLCSYVRNELVHSLKTDEINKRLNAVREAYLAITDHERQKKSIREMTDMDMVTSAIFDCGSHIVIATEKKVEADKKQK